MHPNEQLLHTFYQAFQRKDYATMQACYADSATFNDPVFPGLNARQTRNMWEMLIRRSKELQLTYRVISAGEDTGRAEWTATYRFGKADRPVVNHVQAGFLFADGKITAHTDHFDFYAWSRQALGLSGTLLGWTDFLQRRVQRTAIAGLLTFMTPPV